MAAFVAILAILAIYAVCMGILKFLGGALARWQLKKILDGDKKETDSLVELYRPILAQSLETEMLIASQRRRREAKEALATKYNKLRMVNAERIFELSELLGQLERSGLIDSARELSIQLQIDDLQEKNRELADEWLAKEAEIDGTKLPPDESLKDPQANRPD